MAMLESPLIAVTSRLQKIEGEGECVNQCPGKEDIKRHRCERN